MSEWGASAADLADALFNELAAIKLAQAEILSILRRERSQLPPRTPAMFVYQPSWNGITLRVPNEVGTGLQWVRANQTPAGEVATNSSFASSDVVGDVLKLKLAPSEPFQQLAARVVLTNERTQWTALAPYANTTIYQRFYLRFPTLPMFDMNASGRWCSLAQWKDLPDSGALLQLNVDGEYRLWLGQRPASSRTLALFNMTRDKPMQAGVWKQIDVIYRMTSKGDGLFHLYSDGIQIARAEGITAAVSGFVSFHFALYTNALKSGTELEVGSVLMSSEAL